METLFQYISPPSQCSYLPDQMWSLEYTIVAGLTVQEYMDCLERGWRRFGNMLFRPRCRHCRACTSLRVVASRYRPNRSQRRAMKANRSDLRLEINRPSVTRQKLRLYDTYHAFQRTAKGWPEHPAKDAASYAQSFVNNPFPTEEWCYYLGDKLLGVGYVDRLPTGMSAIYFFHDPAHRDRSLGTWNIMRLIEECVERKLPHLYLGYYVADCPSLCYKANFVPNEILDPSGTWVAFRN